MTDRVLLVGNAFIAVSQDQKIHVREIEPIKRAPVSHVTADTFEVLPMEATVHVEGELLRDVADRMNRWNRGRRSFRSGLQEDRDEQACDGDHQRTIAGRTGEPELIR